MGFFCPVALDFPSALIQN